MVRSLVVVVIALAHVAPAVAGSRTRIVLADEDPELRRALSGALAPWHVELMVDATAIRDEDDAIHRAASWNARFIVWREHDQLVVFDRDRALADRRPTRGGVFDPPGAAAAALTVKTMLRLPPLAESATPEPIEVPPTAADRGGMELRVEVGGAGRVAFATSTAFGARQFDAVMLRPRRGLGLRLGLGGQFGSEIAVERAGFKGGWSDWDVDALASWDVAIGDGWELAPFAGVGIAHSRLSGTSMAMARAETDTAFTGLGGLAVRRHLGGAFTAVANLTVRGVANPPTYTSNQGQSNAEVFQAPGIAACFGLGISVDFSL